MLYMNREKTSTEEMLINPGAKVQHFQNHFCQVIHTVLRKQILMKTEGGVDF